MKTLSAPIEVRWLITGRCNLNCKHCLVSGFRNTPDLPTEKIRSIVRQITDLKVSRVFVSGGEPLLHKDFFLIIDTLKKAGVKTHLFTNGILVTKDMARRLSRYGIDSYHLSLDGASKKAHETIRGKGTFTKTIKAIKNLVAQKCNVIIAATMTHLNYHEAEKIILLSRKLGAKRVQLVELTYSGNALRNRKSIAMTPKERFELLKSVKVLKERYDSFLAGSISQNIKTVFDPDSDKKLIFPLNKVCFAGNKQCGIRPDGWVTPCERLWFLKAGDLNKKTFSDIWNNSSVMKLFRRGFKIRKKDLAGCLKCKHIRECVLIRRCTPHFFFPDKGGYKKLFCLNRRNVC